MLACVDDKDMKTVDLIAKEGTHRMRLYGLHGALLHQNLRHEFGRWNVWLVKDRGLKSWHGAMDLDDAVAFDLLGSEAVEAQFCCADGSEWKGRILVTRTEIGPRPSPCQFQGTGPLTKVQ